MEQQSSSLPFLPLPSFFSFSSFCSFSSFLGEKFLKKAHIEWEQGKKKNFLECSNWEVSIDYSNTCSLSRMMGMQPEYTLHIFTKELYMRLHKFQFISLSYGWSSEGEAGLFVFIYASSFKYNERTPKLTTLFEIVEWAECTKQKHWLDSLKNVIKKKSPAM